MIRILSNVLHISIDINEFIIFKNFFDQNEFDVCVDYRLIEIIHIMIVFFAIF